MNNIYKKLITFLGVGIFSVGIFGEQLSAAADDAITTAVKALCDPYIIDTGNPAKPYFDLTTWINGDPYRHLPTHTTYTTREISITPGSDEYIRIYALGTLNEDIRSPYSSQPIWIKSSVDDYSATIVGNGYQIYMIKDQNTHSSTALDVAFKAKDILYEGHSQHPNEMFSMDDPGLPNTNNFFRFYDLSGYRFNNVSLNGYWLAGFVSKINYSSTPVALIPGWDEVVAGNFGSYEEIVFLVGPNTVASVPEPRVYILLGALLSGVGFVAYRRRQQTSTPQ